MATNQLPSMRAFDAGIASMSTQQQYGAVGTSHLPSMHSIDVLALASTMKSGDYSPISFDMSRTESVSSTTSITQSCGERCEKGPTSETTKQRNYAEPNLQNMGHEQHIYETRP